MRKTPIWNNGRQPLKDPTRHRCKGCKKTVKKDRMIGKYCLACWEEKNVKYDWGDEE